jgi:hypothetical protein
MCPNLALKLIQLLDKLQNCSGGNSKSISSEVLSHL